MIYIYINIYHVRGEKYIKTALKVTVHLEYITLNKKERK